MGIVAYALATTVFSAGGGGGRLFINVGEHSGSREGAQERYLLLVAGLVASDTKTVECMLYPDYIASRNQKRKAMHIITLCRPIINRTMY
jgi:hypothetical protein